MTCTPQIEWMRSPEGQAKLRELILQEEIRRAVVKAKALEPIVSETMAQVSKSQFELPVAHWLREVHTSLEGTLKAVVACEAKPEVLLKDAKFLHGIGELNWVLHMMLKVGSIYRGLYLPPSRTLAYSERAFRI